MSGIDVLVVDDNSADIRFIEESFESSRLSPTVHTANTKNDALDLVYNRNEYEDAPEFDVVLLDWHLSRSTSEEVLDAVKSVHPRLPVIVMTGSESELNEVKSLAPEAETWIEKPTKPERYIEVLPRILLINRYGSIR